MIIYKAGFSVSRPNHIKKYWQDIFVNISSQIIVSQIKTTGTSCKTLYNVLGRTHITVWGLRRCTFFGRGMVYVGGGRFMLTRVGFISEWNCKRVSRFWIKRLAATTFRAELKRRVAFSLKAGCELVEFYIFSV